MNKMLFDRTGNRAVPAGYKLIDSDIAFLKMATEDTPLMIRGERLCQWAADFCIGRHIFYQDLLPPTEYLCQFGLTQTEAAALSIALPSHIAEQLDNLNLNQLLQAIFPNALWDDWPAKNHAADWLLWLYEEPQNPIFEPLFVKQSQIWQQQVTDIPPKIYEATNGEAAGRLLEIWLGLTPESITSELGKFPRKLSPKLRKNITQKCKNEIITKKGKLIYKLTSSNTSPDLRQLVAKETVEYLEYNPTNIDIQLKNTLTPYLTSEQRSVILRLLPPSQPNILPAEPEAVLSWFRNQYLPARQWQLADNPDDDQLHINTRAKEFAQWYLDQYPKALSGNSLQNHLSFKRAAATGKQDSYVTLLIVLDGLHVGDAQQLLEDVTEQAPRLTIFADELAFAPLPTITEICKPALFAGVSPELASQVPLLGKVISQNETAIDQLSNATLGELYLWRIMEPDNTYHQKNSAGTLRADIKGQLHSVASKIKDVVKSVPEQILLRLILTTDHGRLLAKSKRTLDVPAGMISHGRAATGETNYTFDQNGYIINDNIVYLHPKRFGLPNNAAITLNEDTFRTNDGKTGDQWYPHGGLYPEEVIIPWIELIRDLHLPEINTTLTGTGQTGQTGQLTLTLSNSGNIALTITTLTLSSNQKRISCPVHETVSPYSYKPIPVSCTPWPSKAETTQLTVELELQLPNKLTYRMIIKNPTLESIEMYSREDILGNLEL